MAGYKLREIREFYDSGKTKKGGGRDILIRENDSVVYKVWGNTIARIHFNINKMWITDAGWRTTLTKDRLNKLLPYGYNIKQKKGVWYLNDKVFSGKEIINF